MACGMSVLTRKSTYIRDHASCTQLGELVGNFSSDKGEVYENVTEQQVYN